MRRSLDDICKSMVQNGITVHDLQANFDKGYRAGYRKAGEQIVKGCYAAVCLALNELHGFGHKRCRDVLCKIDELMLYQLTTDEAVNEVWEKTGLKIHFDEALDRVSDA